MDPSDLSTAPLFRSSGSDAFDLFPGKVISHYRLEEYLGRGAMGMVWKATDLRLKRYTALKFLAAMSGDLSDASLRLQIEAQAAAALDHPAVCTVFEIDQDAGSWFIAMAYIEGETLAQKIRSGPLDIPFALRIAVEVADGLAAAHSRSILHRDVKSSNIMVTSENNAKILDFGLARIGWSQRLTVAGTLVGTPAYMSPEQIQGEQLDTRSDIWSLGVVVYEMLTGRLPFEPVTVSGLLHAMRNPFPAPSSLRTDVPGALDGIVLKALGYLPGQRYASAALMRDELQSLLEPGTVRASGNGITARLRPADKPSVAVLPFVNLTSDPAQEYFADGLTDELIWALSRLPGLRVVSRTSAFSVKGKGLDMQEIGAMLRVNTILEGTVRKVGNRLRVSVQLVKVSDGYSLWAERYDGVLDDLLAVEDDIARQIFAALKLHFEDALYPRHRTDNPEAYKAYLRGQFHLQQLNPAHLPQASAAFEEALALDGEYARAHVGMAGYYTRMAHFGLMAPQSAFSKARDAASAALRIDPRLAEAHAAMGEILLHMEWNRPGAEEYFRDAIQLGAGDALIRRPYAVLLESSGRFDEALFQVREALELDPLSKPLYNSLVFLFYYARQYDLALEACDKVLELDPNYLHTLAGQGLIYAALGRTDDALRVLDRCRVSNPGSTIYYAYACGLAGRIHEARDILDTTLQAREHSWIPPSALATACMGIGDHEQAFLYLEEAIKAHDPIANFLGVIPIFDPLRASPRFAALLSAIGLPPFFEAGKLTSTVSLFRRSSRSSV